MSTIGQLARQVGVRTSAIRYYETQGLLMARGRTSKGYRIYDESHVSILRFIRRAQELSEFCPMIERGASQASANKH